MTVTRFIRTLMFSSVLGTAALSCTKEGSDSPGTVGFRLTENFSLGECSKSGQSSLGDYTDVVPAGNDFSLLVRRVNGGETVYDGNISGWNPERKLPSGKYTATVAWGNASDEGFDKPCFGGESGFEIIPGESGNVEIEARVANSLVRIKCTDALEKYFRDYSFTVHTGAGKEIQFGKGETRAAFIDCFKFRISGVLVTGSGSKVNFESGEYSDLAPANCYTVTIDAPGIGSPKIEITFNDNVETINLEEDLNE